MGIKTVQLKARIKELEGRIGQLDGKKVRKPRKKKVYDINNLPYTNGMGGRKILKDGNYGNINVYFGRIYEPCKMTRAEEERYIVSLHENMIRNFGVYHNNFDDTIKTIEVDMPHTRRKRRKKNAVLPNEPTKS